jgi:hypothetical protein
VALFGVIYFLLQAVFEELLLRKAEKPDLITSEKLIQVQTPVDEGKE